MISIKGLIIFIIALLCSYNGVVGVKGIRSISAEEEEKDDLELERQLKILNKTPIKTFQIGKGQTIDCIDIYKQPAFDHPLLKNHKIQLRPSHISPSSHKSQSVLQKVDCPEGTVPIRRTSKEDLIRAKSFGESFPVIAAAANTSTYHQNVVGSADKHIAVVSTPLTGNIYYGVRGILNSQNPEVNTRDQSSSSQVWMESGPASTYSTLQAGWIVSYELFGDYGTHTFGYWKYVTPSSTEGCYNTVCAGFIQTSGSYYLGGLLAETSYYGAEHQYAIEVAIYDDHQTGNWLLSINSVVIGYWPKELVPNLSGVPNTVSWGGLVKAGETERYPAMGNGYFPPGNRIWRYGCYICRMDIMKAHEILSGHYWEFPEDNLEKHEDREHCYQIEYYGYVDQNYRKALQFGGPAGYCD